MSSLVKRFFLIGAIIAAALAGIWATTRVVPVEPTDAIERSGLTEETNRTR